MIKEHRYHDFVNIDTVKQTYTKNPRNTCTASFKFYEHGPASFNALIIGIGF